MDKYCMDWNFTGTQSEFLKSTKKIPFFILLGFFPRQMCANGKMKSWKSSPECLWLQFQEQCKNEWSRNPTSSQLSLDLSAVDLSLSTLAKTLQIKSAKTFKFLPAGHRARVQDLPKINWARNEHLVPLLASWNNVTIDTHLCVPLTTETGMPEAD